MKKEKTAPFIQLHALYSSFCVSFFVYLCTLACTRQAQEFCAFWKIVIFAVITHLLISHFLLFIGWKIYRRNGKNLNSLLKIAHYSSTFRIGAIDIDRSSIIWYVTCLFSYIFYLSYTIYIVILFFAHRVENPMRIVHCSMFISPLSLLWRPRKKKQ